MTGLASLSSLAAIGVVAAGRWSPSLVRLLMST